VLPDALQNHDDTVITPLINRISELEKTVPELVPIGGTVQVMPRVQVIPIF
jgi:hypothetical protein